MRTETGVRLGNTGEGPAEDPECGRPLDLSALRDDDALLDALGAGLIRPDEPYPGCAESDRELVAMLAAWVAQARPDETEPLPDLDPLPLSIPAAAAGRRARPRLAAVPPPVPQPAIALRPDRPADTRRGLLAIFGRRLAAAALLVGLASSGLAAGMASSEPGASTAVVSRVSFAERARSVAAAAQVTDELQSARTALEEGRREDAARLLASAGNQLPAVRPDDGRAQLGRDHRRLSQVLTASGGPPAAGDLVLAGPAPVVNPSDFLGNLTNDNDALDPVPPTGPDASDGSSGTVLAEGTTTTTPGRSTENRVGPAPTGSTGANTGSAEQRAEETTPESASNESSAAQGQTTGGQNTGGQNTEGQNTEESRPAEPSSPDASTEKPSTEQPTTSEPTTGQSTTEKAATTEKATTEQATTTEREPDSAGASTSRERSAGSDTSRREPIRPAGKPTANGHSPSTTPDEPATTGRNAAAQETDPTTVGRPKSTSPRSRDFIGPVQGRTTQGFTPPTTAPSSRAASTGRSTQSKSRSSTTRTSRTSTSQDRSTGDDQDD